MAKINKKKVNELLEEVLEIESSNRQQFLEEQKIDGDIRKEIERLLSFEEEAENSLNLSAVAFSESFLGVEQINSLMGQKVGVFEIIRELGYGGMGAVYLAERTDGKFTQKVAVKLLKREMNTALLRRRFQHEQEILASLEHPNIARLLDAGTTDDGIPYLAMEYVEGIPITDYCNKNDLSLNKRLDLFRKVCSTVNFAHRNLVVHRDLKPSNILVTENGIPKLLDFGISKILSEDIGQTNIATVTELGVMTPSYASPEQLQKKSVTTATDIYSLGVILYELLSGHRPFEEKEDDLKEIYSAVIEDEPPLPSAVTKTYSNEFKNLTNAETDVLHFENNESKNVTKTVKEITDSPKSVHTSPTKINIKPQSLQGDLDNIILKALKKEPERRYSSAESFAEDIRRHQTGLPVTARPDTFVYRTGKFVKRNSLAVFAGVLITLAIFGGVAATLWQARQTQAEADRAKAEASKVKKTLGFVESILNFSSPYWHSSNPERKKTATISEAMDIALENVDKDISNDPEVQAEVLYILATAYMGKGDYVQSEKTIRRAIKTFNQVYGEGNTRSMQLTGKLGNHLYVQGKLDEAQQNYLEAINYLRPRLTEDEENSVYLAPALTGLGNIFLLKGNYKEAEKLNLEALKLAETFKGKERRMLPIILGNIGKCKTELGDYKGAREYYGQALAKLRENGTVENLDGGVFNTYLGEIESKLGNSAEAEKYFQKSYSILKKNAGEKSVYTLNVKNLMAQFYYEQKEYEKSKKLALENLSIGQEVFPKGHFVTASSRLILGNIYTRQNKLNEGEQEIRKVLDYFLVKNKEPNPAISRAKHALGLNLVAQKRFDTAREMFKSALDGFIKTKGEDHPETQKSRKELDNINKKPSAE